MRPAFPSLGEALQAETPVVIPCFNAVTYARSMVEQLHDRGLRRLILLDNASTYPSMRDYLAAPGDGVTVIAQVENKGPRDTLLDPVSFALLPQYFCLTDPDLVLNPDMPSDFVARLAALTEELEIGKAGLALDIADRDAMRQDDFLIGDQPWKIWDWEAQYWREPLTSRSVNAPVFKAPVDTTFAVYNKRFFESEKPLQGVRVGGSFTCRHLPWYKDNGLPADEEAYYRAHARDSFYLPPLGDDRNRKVRYETPVALAVQDTPSTPSVAAVAPTQVQPDGADIRLSDRTGLRWLAERVSALLAGRRR